MVSHNADGIGMDDATATKCCPACAEPVAAAARLCRYCSHDFTGSAMVKKVAGIALGLICAFLLWVWATTYLW